MKLNNTTAAQDKILSECESFGGKDQEAAKIAHNMIAELERNISMLCKKYIRFFRNKEDTMPVTSFQLAPIDKQTNNTILDTSEEVYAHINQWMNIYVNGKVDFVWLP